MTLILDIPETRLFPAVQEPDYSVPEERGALAELSESYRRIGFEAGYAQAARDQLEYSVAVAEKVLSEHNYANGGANGGSDARRLLYAFIARCERRLALFANSTTSEQNEGFMEGGLGI